jgi:hypothetical protein
LTSIANLRQWVVAGVVTGRLDRLAQLVEQVAGERGDQRLEAGEVAVDGRRGHADVARDRPQRDCRRAALDEQASRGLLDLGDRRLAKPLGVTANRGGSSLVTVTYPGEPTVDAARQLVRDIRGLPEPVGAEVLVTGRTATDVDLLDSLGTHLPWP